MSNILIAFPVVGVFCFWQTNTWQKKYKPIHNKDTYLSCINQVDQHTVRVSVMSSATDEPRKRTLNAVDGKESKKHKHEKCSVDVVADIAMPSSGEGGIAMKMDSVARGMVGSAATLAGRGMSALNVADDPQGQFLVMMTSNAKKSSETSKEKGNDFMVINFVILKALKAGFSSTPYEV